MPQTRQNPARKKHDGSTNSARNDKVKELPKSSQAPKILHPHCLVMNFGSIETITRTNSNAKADNLFTYGCSDAVSHSENTSPSESGLTLSEAATLELKYGKPMDDVSISNPIYTAINYASAQPMLITPTQTSSDHILLPYGEKKPGNERLISGADKNADRTKSKQGSKSGNSGSPKRDMVANLDISKPMDERAKVSSDYGRICAQMWEHIQGFGDQLNLSVAYEEEKNYSLEKPIGNGVTYFAVNERERGGLQSKTSLQMCNNAKGGLENVSEKVLPSEAIPQKERSKAKKSSKDMVALGKYLDDEVLSQKDVNDTAASKVRMLNETVPEKHGNAVLPEDKYLVDDVLTQKDVNKTEGYNASGSIMQPQTLTQTPNKDVDNSVETLTHKALAPKNTNDAAAEKEIVIFETLADGTSNDKAASGKSLSPKALAQTVLNKTATLTFSDAESQKQILGPKSSKIKPELTETPTLDLLATDTLILEQTKTKIEHNGNQSDKVTLDKVALKQRDVKMPASLSKAKSTNQHRSNHKKSKGRQIPAAVTKKPLSNPLNIESTQAQQQRRKKATKSSKRLPKTKKPISKTAKPKSISAVITQKFLHAVSAFKKSKNIPSNTRPKAGACHCRLRQQKAAAGISHDWSDSSSSTESEITLFKFALERRGYDSDTLSKTMIETFSAKLPSDPALFKEFCNIREEKTAAEKKTLTSSEQKPETSEAAVKPSLEIIEPENSPDDTLQPTLNSTEAQSNDKDTLEQIVRNLEDFQSTFSIPYAGDTWAAGFKIRMQELAKTSDHQQQEALKRDCEKMLRRDAEFQAQMNQINSILEQVNGVTHSNKAEEEEAEARRIAYEGVFIKKADVPPEQTDFDDHCELYPVPRLTKEELAKGMDAYLLVNMLRRSNSADSLDQLSHMRKKQRIQHEHSKRLKAGLIKCVRYRNHAMHFIEKHQLNFPYENPSQLLSKSLFPQVAPYISFSSAAAKGPKVYPELRKMLRWYKSCALPSLVLDTLMNTGFGIGEGGKRYFVGVWHKSLHTDMFKHLYPYQKICQLPKSHVLCFKDDCWRLLKHQNRRDSWGALNFMPESYVLPKQRAEFEEDWAEYAEFGAKWIVKPPKMARGMGIKIIHKWQDIPLDEEIVVQRYIERPLLIDGYKFDMRLYVIITSICPLRIYLHREGLIRFATVRYSSDENTLSDACMHLTNTSVNRNSTKYKPNPKTRSCQGHKWILSSFMSYLSKRGANPAELWEAIKSIIIRTVLAAEPIMARAAKEHLSSNYCAFELYGVDILLDEEMRPWLLEFNLMPALGYDTQLDLEVKATLVQAMLNVALFNVPPLLQRKEQEKLASRLGDPHMPVLHQSVMYTRDLTEEGRRKQAIFTSVVKRRADYLPIILETLTPEDVRCLIISEDELARKGPLERIFPTVDTYKYAKYFRTKRYYNKLLDAWESHYHQNREAGYEVLRELCKRGVHLIRPNPTELSKKLLLRHPMKRYKLALK